MIIENYQPFIGQHCETTATGSLLNQIGIELSEPMLFGIGEGLSFIYWNMKTMDAPFLGGRIKPDQLTENLCRNLGLTLIVKETTSLKKAWATVQENLEKGKVVGLKLDCYHLEYFTNKIHFAGHYVAMYGFDEAFAYLTDTQQQGSQVKTTLKNLELARNERGPMSSKNKSYIIEPRDVLLDIKKAIKKAIFNNANEYLNPPIKNVSYKGIKKTATEIKKWFKHSNNIAQEFQLTAVLMEKAGTGGALFRNFYRDFLKESSELLQMEELSIAADEFTEIATLWTAVADLFHKVGATKEEKYLQEASDILLALSEKEKRTMESLSSAFKF